MSYPQPNADQYCISGYQYFRLNTPLSSPGDIYESAQSGHALAVGPESDIANVVVNYFDDQVRTFIQQTVISPSRAFVGRVDARNDALYSPAQRPGRVLFWPADIFDPNFHPISFNVAAHDVMLFITPQLDVIQYFTPIESMGPARIDKSYLFQNYPATSGGTQFIVIPYYGRKYCYAQFTNRNTTDPATFGVIGVNYAITQDDSAVPYHQETQILAPTPVITNASVTQMITSGEQGMFDALVFSVQGGDPSPLRIVVSDTPAGS